MNKDVDDEGGAIGLYCVNEENMNDTIAKMKEQLGGYTIKNLELNPLPLKKPVMKCNRWSLEPANIVSTVLSVIK
jgi:hypothetical protein